MTAAITYFYFALFCIAIYVVVSIIIISELRKREVPINFIFLRLFLIKYVHQYKQITCEEKGSPGILYYIWIISVNMALVSLIIGIILR